MFYSRKETSRPIDFRVLSAPNRFSIATGENWVRMLKNVERQIMVSHALGVEGRPTEEGSSQSAEATKCNDYGPFIERSKSRAPSQTRIDSIAINLRASRACSLNYGFATTGNLLHSPCKVCLQTSCFMILEIMYTTMYRVSCIFKSNLSNYVGCRLISAENR